MKKPKYSPGPWRVVRNHPDPKTRESLCGIKSEKGMFGYKDSSLFIAELFCADMEEQKANAQLIAAAPDLLKACQLILKCDVTGGGVHAATVAAKAAISKAFQQEAP